MRTSASRAFTLVEMLIVVAILAVIATVSAVTFSNIKNHQQLRVATQDVYVALIDARALTLGSSDDTVYGVHVTADEQVVRFKGASYTPGDPDNVLVPLPPEVVATSSFAGGTFEVVFTRLSGDASTEGMITLTDTRSGATSTVEVHASGLIEH